MRSFEPFVAGALNVAVFLSQQHFYEHVFECVVVVRGVLDDLQGSGAGGDDVKLLEQAHHFLIVHVPPVVRGRCHFLCVLSVVGILNASKPRSFASVNSVAGCGGVW